MNTGTHNNNILGSCLGTCTASFIHPFSSSTNTKYKSGTCTRIRVPVSSSTNIRTSTTTTRTTIQSLKEPDQNESNFGRQKYWNDFYESKDEFSWYSPWEDIAPFFTELVPLQQEQQSSSSSSSSSSNEQSNNPAPPTRVLLPGIGNDSSMVDMYDEGYTHLTAFDYAQEGVTCAKNFFGEQRLRNGVEVTVADARDLSYESNSFDAVLEKGTLDAIYLSGGKNKEVALLHLTMAVEELSRVVRSGGIVMSVTAACAETVKSVFASRSVDWEVVRDGEFYMTQDGYSSNNVDATIFAWKRK